jgi:hypothetical protein
MATAAASILAPVIEPVMLSGTSFTIRVTRVPTALINASTGGYVVYRSTDESAWAKVENTDFIACSPTLAQPASTSPLPTVTLTSQPTSGTVYYRARADDVLGAPTQRSPWSNVIVVYDRAGTRVAVPAWPVDVVPNTGALAGVIRQFEDSDSSAGVTWHDARTVMVRFAEQLYDELRQSMKQGQALAVFEAPPPALRHWFEYTVAAELVHRSSLPTEKLVEVAGRLQANAAKWWDELTDDTGSFLLPGAGAATIGAGRVVR